MFADRGIALLFSLLLVAMIAAGSAVAQDRRCARHWQCRTMPTPAALANPGNDARAVAAALRDIGFEVVEGHDLGRNDMEGQIRTFLNKSSSAKVALLFYAGHGMQIDGRNYLVPVDANLETPNDVTFGTVELDRILSGSERSVAGEHCGSRCLPGQSDGAKLCGPHAFRGGRGGACALYQHVGTGTLIAFSTAPGKVAADGMRGNSPFAEALAKHLRTPGLEVRQMLTRVRNEVAAATDEKQVPWDNSSLRGDIILPGLPGDVGPADPSRRIETLPAPQPPQPMKPAILQPPANRAAGRAGGRASERQVVR